MKSGDDAYFSKLSEAVSERLGKYGIKAGAIRNLLNHDELRKEIGYLRNHYVPDRFIYRIVSNGIVESMQTEQRPSITPEIVAFMVYDQLKKDRRYEHFAKELVDEGIIESKEAEKFRKTLDERLKRHRKEIASGSRTLEELLKKAVIYIPFAISIGFMLFALVKATYTGAVIGGGEVDINVLLGVGFLFLGLALYHFSSKNHSG